MGDVLLSLGSFWKPLVGPVNDWPLLLCDASTINPATDLEVADLLYPDHVTENSMVYYRSDHKWYYLSDHNTDEVIVFKQMDSQEGSLPGKHSSPPCFARVSLSRVANSISICQVSLMHRSRIRSRRLVRLRVKALRPGRWCFTTKLSPRPSSVVPFGIMPPTLYGAT